MTWSQSSRSCSRTSNRLIYAKQMLKLKLNSGYSKVNGNKNLEIFYCKWMSRWEVFWKSIHSLAWNWNFSQSTLQSLTLQNFIWQYFIFTLAISAERAHLSLIDIFPFILQISFAYIEILSGDNPDLRPIKMSIPTEQFKATSRVRTIDRKSVV